ncbi:MAG: hypothetical protein IJW41_01475 [Oscillospiraceae bacterium]|nr:hypothetical protein [Oscillospiraceae bacterium]
MNSLTITGNKGTIRVVVYVLVLFFLLAGCAKKTDSNKAEGNGNGAVGDMTTDPVGTTGTTSIMAAEEKTQNNTKPNGSTTPDDKSTTEDSAPDTESPEKSTDGSTETIPAGENDGTLATEPAITPTDNTATTTPKNEGNAIPDYGIELPDDNWD